MQEDWLKIGIIIWVFIASFFFSWNAFSQDITPGMDLPVGYDISDNEEEEDKPDEEDPPVFYDEEIPIRKGLTFVIDRSGSMAMGTNPFVDMEGKVQYGTRMDKAKIELTKAIISLSENHTFDIVAYWHCTQILCFDKKAKATKQNKKKAIDWVNALRPNGMTGTARAVLRGLANEDDTIVLLTDGAPNLCPGDPEFERWFPRGFRSVRGLWWTEPWYQANVDITEQIIVTSCNAKDVKCHTFGIEDIGRWQQMLMNIASKTKGKYVHVQ